MIGIHLQLFQGTTPLANQTDIQASWWDVTEPKDASAPVGKSAIVTTDANGYIDLDLSNVTGLAIGCYGFLTLYKLNDIDHEDSLVFSGKVQTSDITSGIDMYYYDPGWTAPSYWPVLDEPVDGVEKVQGLFAVYDVEAGVNGVAFTMAGAYTVDWGDGNVENIATNVKAEHMYEFSNAAIGPVCPKGYRIAKVTITPQGVGHLTSVNFNIRHSNYISARICPWLSFVVNVPFCTALNLGVYSYNVHFATVESIIIKQHNDTNFSYLFYLFRQLRNIDINTSIVTNFSYMFSQCNLLEEVSLIDASIVTSIAGIFSGCVCLNTGALLGTKVSISYIDCNLGPEALNEIYTNLATVTGQTIIVTNNWGAATSDPEIARAKGWEVIL